MEKSLNWKPKRGYERRFSRLFILWRQTKKKYPNPNLPQSLVYQFPPLSKSFVPNKASFVPNTGMFGRVRASPSPSSLDSFETPPSKIIKDDALSIYETTLMKLKLGSQRHPIPPPTMVDLTDSCSGTIPDACQEMHSDDESMVIDTDCSSASARVVDWSSDCQSTGNLNLNSLQQRNGTSILDLFSKFKSHQGAPTISDETTMVDINDSAHFSSSIEFQSLSSAEERNP